MRRSPHDGIIVESHNPGKALQAGDGCAGQVARKTSPCLRDLEEGLFASQLMVCKLRDERLIKTVEAALGLDSAMG